MQITIKEDVEMNNLEVITEDRAEDSHCYDNKVKTEQDVNIIAPEINDTFDYYSSSSKINDTFDYYSSSI